MLYSVPMMNPSIPIWPAGRVHAVCVCVCARVRGGRDVSGEGGRAGGGCSPTRSRRATLAPVRRHSPPPPMKITALPS